MDPIIQERIATEKREKRRKNLLSAGAGVLAVLAIGGAGFAIWESRGVSRAERIAERGAPQPDQRPVGERNRASGNRGGWGGGRGGDGGQRREQRQAEMNAELGLTPDQQTQVKQLGESMRPQMQALWQNQSLSREDKRTQMQALRTQMEAKMRSLLTPDQQAKFDAMQQQRQQRRQELRERREQTREAVIASGQTPPARGQGRGGRDR